MATNVINCGVDRVNLFGLKISLQKSCFVKKIGKIDSVIRISDFMVISKQIDFW